MSFQERSAYVEDIAEFLADKICYRRDDYAIQLQTGAYSRQGTELTYDDILAHVRGEYTIGVYQSTYPEEYCKWIAYDIDGVRKPTDNPATSRIQLTMLKSILIENDVPFYVEDSGSIGSSHIWVFLERPTPLYLAYNWARAMIVRGDHYVFNSEIFPKQAALNPEKPYGNLVKVPFGIHQKSGRRTYFYDSSRGKPDPYMGKVETVDISNWKPVNLPRNERGERKVTDQYKRGLRESDSKISCVDDVGLYRYSSNIRPCIRAMLETGVQFRHDDGHKLRIAIASELLRCGTTFEEVVNAFRGQEDFDYGITRYQVQSVRGFNRPTCDRIRWHARNLVSESGFNIDEMCNECVFCPECSPSSKHGCQEMNHEGTRL